MNLSPLWVPVLEEENWIVKHWANIGSANATDRFIFEWAKKRGFIIFTHDLDFGSILSATNADFPSVIQIRTQNIMPEKLSKRLISVLKEYEIYLKKGILLTVDDNNLRVRILPVHKNIL